MKLIIFAYLASASCIRKTTEVERISSKLEYRYRYGYVWLVHCDLPPPLLPPSLLQLVASLGKQYIVWQEIFDNGLKVSHMYGCRIVTEA